MGVKIASAGIGLIFSAFLISYPLIVVIGLLFGIAVLEVLMCAVLYRIVMREKRGLRERAI